MTVKVAVDQGVDLKALRKVGGQGTIALHQVHDLEQRFPGVRPQGRAFRLDVSVLDGPDMLADEKFVEVLQVVGAENEIDADHVYAAYLNRCDYFVTENPDHFIADGRRWALCRPPNCWSASAPPYWAAS